MIQLRVIPGHDERAGSAGAAAPSSLVLQDLFVSFDVILSFDAGQYFFLDKFCIRAGHGVILQAALATLGIAAAIADGDGDHRRHTMGCDQVVEYGEEVMVGPVGADDE